MNRDNGFSGVDGLVAIGVYAALICAAILGLLFVFAGVGESFSDDDRGNPDHQKAVEMLLPKPVREKAKP